MNKCVSVSKQNNFYANVIHDSSSAHTISLRNIFLANRSWSEPQRAAPMILLLHNCYVKHQ